MDKRENAQKRLDAFENIDRTRTLNKNNTLSSFNESLTTNPVGKMVGQIQNNAPKSSSYNNLTYDGYEIDSDDFDDFDDDFDNDGADDFTDKFSSEDLDTLNFEREIMNAKERKPYSHEVPYKKDNFEEFDSLSSRELNKINQSIRNPFASEFDGQDTSNLSKIDDVSDFFNDPESDRRKNHLRKNVAKNHQRNKNYEYETMHNIEALSGKKPSRRRDDNDDSYEPKASSYRLLAGETLSNNYNLDEYKDYKESRRPRQEAPQSSSRRSQREYEEEYTERSSRQNDSERREFERLNRNAQRDRENERNIEESRRRLQKRRMEDTNMQPAIKGQTLNIPKSTMANINRGYESQNSQRNHNFETNEYDYTQPIKREQSQREQASNIRREQYEEDDQKGNDKKRSGEAIYKRRFEKARSQSVIIACIGLLVCLIAFGAFFYTLFKYNEVKAKYTALETEYTTLTYEQPEIDALRLEIETLTTERDALLKQVNGEDGDVVTIDGSNTDEENSDGTKPSEGSKTYVVQPGDHLSKIAESQYGDVSYVEKIKEANNLTSDELYAGQTLILP